MIVFLLGVQLVIIQKQVDGLGNFHDPPPGFDGIMLMLIYKAYIQLFGIFEKFSLWQGIFR
jgi:hypothetical protein